MKEKVILMDEKKSVGLAVTSMVLGIISLLFGCCFWYITIPAAVLAVILASVSLSKKMGGSGMAIAGLVTSIISLVPAVVIMITGSSIMAFGDKDKDSTSDSSISSQYGEIYNSTSNSNNSIETKYLNDDESSKTEAIPDRNLPTEGNNDASDDNSKPKDSDLSIEEIKKLIENGDYSLVTPEFKETMDSYEAFCDDYIKFMKDYQSGDMDFSKMLEDYTKMLSDMGEWTTKIEEMDTENLSPADSAYYTLVTLRVSKKMLDVVI